MPKFLEQYLYGLSKDQAQSVWDWADGDPDVAFKIIDIVAPIADLDAAADVADSFYWRHSESSSSS